MILKQKDDLTPQLDELNRLLSLSTLTKGQRENVEDEISAIRAGAKGEKEAAYHIDFGWKDGTNTVVIHDLRLEHNGRVAQIDHLILMRTLDCHVLESKGFGREVRISESGEWETRTRYGWRGIPSPIEQNRRHIDVLSAFIKDHDLSPKRLGLTMPIRFHNWVLVSPACQLRRKGDEWDQVVKMDMFEKKFMKALDDESVGTTLTRMAKFVSLDTVEALARKLMEAHRPGTFNFAAKFGIVERPVPSPAVAPPPQKPQTATVCGKCGVELEAKVITFCRLNAKKFGGRLLCQPCQKSEAKPVCDDCSAEVDDKVIAFCRFNSKRFGKRVLCRGCQTSTTG